MSRLRLFLEFPMLSITNDNIRVLSISKVHRYVHFRFCFCFALFTEILCSQHDFLKPTISKSIARSIDVTSCLTLGNELVVGSCRKFDISSTNPVHEWSDWSLLLIILVWKFYPVNKNRFFSRETYFFLLNQKFSKGSLLFTVWNSF